MLTPSITLSIVTGLILVFLAYFFVLLVKNQAVFVPLPSRTIDTMLTMANVRSDDLLYDLGCGDGRVVIAAAKKYGAAAVGVEKSKILAWFSTRAVRKNGLQDRVRIVNGDLFAVNLSQASIITAYLSGKMNRQLEPKLRTELKDGTRILSADHTFNFTERSRARTGHFWIHLYTK